MVNWVNWSEPEYNGEYPQWAKALGWLIMITTLIGIPGRVVFVLLRTEGSFREVRRVQIALILIFLKMALDRYLDSDITK